MLCEEEVALPTKHNAHTVLIVEDDEDTQALFTEVISLCTSYQSHVAKNSTEALHFVTHSRPNVVLLDPLPNGRNGIDLYDRLCAFPGCETIPAIIISAIPSEQLTGDIESRNLFHLEKPFDLDVLLDTLKQALA